MKKFVVLLIFLGAVAFVGWEAHKRALAKAAGNGGGNRRRGGQVVAVAAAPVRQTEIRDIAEFTGSLIARSQFDIAPKVPGRLEKLTVNIGDTIQSGDLVAVLESAEYAQQAAQAKAELEVVKANLAESKSALEIAERDFRRVRELREQKVASESELDQAQARHQAALARHEVVRAQIRQRESALQTAELRLSYTSIYANWEENATPRRIASRYVDEGALLRINDPLVSVVDLSSVIAVITVIERDFARIRVGQETQITTDVYPERRFTGRIIRYAPVLREESRQARAEIEIANPDALLAPGMFVRAEIQFDRRENATAVPVSALVRRNGNQGVFIVDAATEDGPKVRFVPVKVGIVQGEIAEILEPAGLTGKVIILGHHLLEDGVGIILPDSGSGTAKKSPGAKKGGAKGAGAKD